MARNHEVTERNNLLNPDGTLREPGWSKSLIQTYNREDIGAPKFRIKEWDYYLVVSEEHDIAVAFTISDDGYIGLQSASFLDLGETPWEHTETILNAFPMGKLKLPTSSVSGVTKYQDKRLDMHFDAGKDKRVIFCDYKNFHEGKTLKCNITLSQPPMDTMVIATPWKEKKTAFYYNQKINCMRASGTIEFDGVTYELNPEIDYGTLDWGRGVWTYDNTWYWGSGNATVNGKPFGFNIGYGFGDTSAASENMLFYAGKAHKLSQVTFNIPMKDGKEDYLKPWTFTSDDGRFEMDFVPVINRASCTDVGLIRSDQNQVFGRFTGTAMRTGLPPRLYSLYTLYAKAATSSSLKLQSCFLHSIFS